MKKQYMFKDDSGAVTVDWVVLTAALVIIGGVVIGIIRGGLIDASSAIDKTLVASATDLRSSLSGGGSASQSFADYMAAAGGDLSAAVDAINADAPDGYTYSGWNETSSGTPLYFGNTESTGSSMSLGGTTYESGELTSNDFTYVGTSGPA